MDTDSLGGGHTSAGLTDVFIFFYTFDLNVVEIVTEKCNCMATCL